MVDNCYKNKHYLDYKFKNNYIAKKKWSFFIYIYNEFNNFLIIYYFNFKTKFFNMKIQPVQLLCHINLNKPYFYPNKMSKKLI